MYTVYNTMAIVNTVANESCHSDLVESHSDNELENSHRTLDVNKCNGTVISKTQDQDTTVSMLTACLF